MKFLALASLFILPAAVARADLTLRFDEGAPKDRFTLTNTGGCPIGAMEVVIDLATSPFGLIFDTTPSGAGVQVYQPFELVMGGANLTALPRVLDGDTAIVLPLNALAVGDSIIFTIDLDDTGAGRQTVVSGSEIAGTTLRANGQIALVDASATARLPLPACTS